MNIRFRAWDKEMNCWGYGSYENGLYAFFEAIKKGELDIETLEIYNNKNKKWESIGKEAK